MCNKNSSLTRH